MNPLSHLDKFDQPPYFVPLRELASDLPSVDLLFIPPYSIIPDCPIPSEIEYYRHLLPIQLEKGLHVFVLALLSVDKSVERGTFSEHIKIEKTP